MEYDIGSKIKNARLEKKLTQEQVAELLGVSRQTISNWENAKSYPDIISVIKMSECYDVSLDYLLKGEQKMDKTAKIRMKAKRNVTDLAGEKVMVDFEQGKYFCIKGVGNDIWDMLDGQEGEDGITVEAILHKLMEEYEVMEEVCEKEVLAFLDKLEQAGILEEV